MDYKRFNYTFKNFDGYYDKHYEEIVKNGQLLLKSFGGNFDYWLYNNHVYSIANCSGCRCTLFGNISYFNRILNRDICSGYIYSFLASKDAIDVDFECFISSHTKPAFWDLYDLAESAGCSFFTAEPVNDRINFKNELIQEV